MQDEHKPQPTRTRDRNLPGGSKRNRDETLSADEPEGDVDVATAPHAGSSTNAATSATQSDAVKEQPVPLPPFKKRRLPPIKKNKPSTIPSVGGTSSQSGASKPSPKPPEVKGSSGFPHEDTTDPLSALKKPKRINNQQEVNLNDRSVYESLFKHVRPPS
jgi:hypothetical protein